MCPPTLLTLGGQIHEAAAQQYVAAELSAGVLASVILDLKKEKEKQTGPDRCAAPQTNGRAGTLVSRCVESGETLSRRVALEQCPPRSLALAYVGRYLGDLITDGDLFVDW